MDFTVKELSSILLMGEEITVTFVVTTGVRVSIMHEFKWEQDILFM